VELDVLEGLAGPSYADLLLGTPVDVVKHRSRRATASDRAQVFHGVCTREATLPPVPNDGFALQERTELGPARSSAPDLATAERFCGRAHACTIEDSVLPPR
jgi:hypothetical protein